jgi:hypothetical protein
MDLAGFIDAPDKIVDESRVYGDENYDGYDFNLGIDAKLHFG